MCRLADSLPIGNGLLQNFYRWISTGRTLPFLRLELVSYMGVCDFEGDHEPRFDGGSHSWHLHHGWIHMLPSRLLVSALKKGIVRTATKLVALIFGNGESSRG